jgi:HlyD family secretion protein
MKKLQQSTISLLVGLGALILVIVVLGVIGWLTSKPQKIILQGDVEAREYRISSKVPGRISQFLAEEGDTVSKGQLVVLIDSPEVQAKVKQANAGSMAANAQNQKANQSARSELVQGAYEMWQKARVGSDIALKSYTRIQNLYNQEVVSAQKRDEVKAQYDAALATEKAAKSQYDMAIHGAQKEDRVMAMAQVEVANSNVTEVKTYLDEINLTAPAGGEITEIYPKVGELVGQGAPIMSIIDMNDVWFTFNVREDLLQGMDIGKTIQLMIPALGENKRFEAKVYFINEMASYATWKATKVSGNFDAKTFEVRARPTEKIKGLRAGMSAIITTVLK